MAEVRESEVLLREVDRCLTRLRLGSDGADLEMAERLASALRRLVTDTAVASAADRAQARAAVHYVARRRPHRPVSADVRVVNDIVRRLGRTDLVVERVREAV